MRIGAIALFSLLAIACGSSYPPPNDEWSAAQQDVGKAEAGGAPDVPDAKLHLQLAQEDLSKAKELIGTDNKRAASLIALARVEAQLALSLAKQQRAEAAAQAAQSQLQQTKGGK